MRSWAAEAVLLAFCSAALGAERLPGQGADSAKFTVSGLSSGGYMAVQLQVAHSSRVSGVAGITSMRTLREPGVTRIRPLPTMLPFAADSVTLTSPPD